MFRQMIVSLMLLVPAVAWPEKAFDEPPADVPEPPELPPRIQSGEEMEPDITIIRKGKDTIQEYRRNGVLYMIKVQPQVGPPYYFLDLNGDGKMDVKKSDLDRNTDINLWTIFSWD
jgi:hypothetical protein